MSRPRLLALMALTTLLAAPLPTAAPAAPQTWEYYTYAQSGFTVQFPAPPATSVGTYKTRDGAAVPSLTWAVQQDGVAYSVMVADFSSRPMNDQSAMNDAIATLKETGEIKVDTNERIDRNFGHDITLVGKDGSRSAIAIFYVGNRLYELIGKALAPNADAGTARTARFQQTLSFIDAQGRAPRRPEDGPGGGPPGGGRGGPGFGPPGAGPGGRRGPPPPQAFEDCKGKKEGEAVQHTTPQGVIAATCVNGPQGLFARPNAPGF